MIGDKQQSGGDGTSLEKQEAHKDFHHPYTPYDIQETFMRTVYGVLQEGKVGILESPTGTGKSLSLLCGSLTWLRDHKGQVFEDGLNWGQEESDEPDWIIEQAKARKRRELLRNREDLEARLTKIRAKEKSQRERYFKGEQRHKKRRKEPASTAEKDEEQFLLDDYESDGGMPAKNGSNGEGFSTVTMELMEKVGMTRSTLAEEETEVEDDIKIFFCSRTHSQLSQFIGELRRVKFPPAILDASAENMTETEDLRHLTLGSRKNLCINPVVNKLHSLTAINERCAELQQSGTVQEHKCVFLPNKENQPLVNDFRDHALASILDIEDMGALGKEMGICPYYASRSAIKPAEIVTLPYPLLLQKSAREALGISLKGHLVIIDEAHNLMDAIASIHGVEVSLAQLKRSRAQLGIYLQKFGKKLKGKNRVYVAQLVRIIDSLSGYLESRLSISKADGIIDNKELLSGKGVDQINLYKLLSYLQESKLARKVEGYAVHATTLAAQATTKATSGKLESTSPVLHQIASLISALTHRSKEGRLFYAKDSSSKDPDSISLKFLLLDPSSHFQEIVSEARAVILAGGTMSPMADYTCHLFPYLAPTSITTLSCGHVIPKSHLVAWNVSTGPSKGGFEFTYKNRGNGEMLDELGRALLNICTIVPDGVVVFFPSYVFLETMIARWSIQKDGRSIYQRLEGKKMLFRERKDAGVDDVLTEYANAIDANKGGLLLSVVGGKMSEGINFSDRLGRCVVIVGLPFPNIASAECKAKIEYIESSTLTRLRISDETLGKEEITRRAKEAGREFYENACMRAVNQSVGRAIRHREDYAAILMIDKRFAGEGIKGKLPGWIREGLVDGAGEKSFGQLMGTLNGFFRVKKG
ncbi:helicase C-terminal domain-containing protein [Calycina marina]|uniref:ATP-dependent DNA helicase CHL1 n=1 Tax=Calycina marina TaxID=1763456 RepID=A0A9P8CEK2_9HELO|nr:helicase C-terminal domain-containing protein [Calycina marina]